MVRRGRRRSFRRSMHQTVIVGVVCATLLAAVGLSSLAASLPSNIVWGGTQLPAVRAELTKVAGQDFAFFTRSPETNEIDVYRLDPDGSVGASLRVTPQAKPANLFGLSRTQRAQGPELAILLHQIPPDGWIDCTELDRPACVDALSRHPKTLLRNNSPVPTVCGQVALSVESTTKWAYRRLTETRYSIERIAAASIDCIHRH
jgi:antimicrobial peptide system SdpA family protein